MTSWPFRKNLPALFRAAAGLCRQGMNSILKPKVRNRPTITWRPKRQTFTLWNPPIDMNTLVFDIETVPDVETGRRLYQLENLSDDDVARVMTSKQAQKTGKSDFLPLHLHRVVAISTLLCTAEAVRVWSLGSPDSPEKEIITRFFDGIARYSPTLVSWNGCAFDLPVLHYRSLLHGVHAKRYWEIGEGEREFRFNNYLSRYHWRHVDLMDILAGFNLRAAAPLESIAIMLGFPGKLGMSGERVWGAFQHGEIGKIRNYCEVDVLNTFLVYLRWELTRGVLDEESYRTKCDQVRVFLKESGNERFSEFLAAWKTGHSGVPYKGNR